MKKMFIAFLIITFCINFNFSQTVKAEQTETKCLDNILFNYNLNTILDNMNGSYNKINGAYGMIAKEIAMEYERNRIPGLEEALENDQQELSKLLDMQSRCQITITDDQFKNIKTYLIGINEKLTQKTTENLVLKTPELKENIKHVADKMVAVLKNASQSIQVSTGSFKASTFVKKELAERYSEAFYKDFTFLSEKEKKQHVDNMKALLVAYANPNPIRKTYEMNKVMNNDFNDLHKILNSTYDLATQKQYINVYSEKIEDLYALSVPDMVSDIADHWSRDTVNWAIQAGIVQGYEDQRFKPNSSVTESEFLAMLLRSFPQYQISDSNSTDWSAPYYIEALKKGLSAPGLKDTEYRNMPIDRGNVALMITSVLGKKLNITESTQFLLDNKISVGKDAPTVEGFKINDLLSRAEAVQFIKNIKDCNIVPEISH